MSEITQQQDSRRIFIDTLIELAEKDNKIVLIVPDVGFNYIEKFKERFPERFFNFGVTEQSTIMIASALALDGWKPYVYSMINFVLFRPYEMVRNGIVQHNANVKLIGVKGSTSYKFLGFSHNMTFDDGFYPSGEPAASEDRNTCINLKLECYIPDKAEKVKSIIESTYNSELPAYIRL